MHVLTLLVLLALSLSLALPTVADSVIGANPAMRQAWLDRTCITLFPHWQ